MRLLHRNTLATAALTGLLLTRSMEGQQATFRAASEAVTVDVLVTGRSGAVVGLRDSDFELRDTGVPQRIEFLGREETPLELVLALDVSASVRGTYLAKLAQACTAIAREVQEGDRVSVIAFNHALSRPETRDEPQGVLEAIRRLEGHGATSLRDATYAAVATAQAGKGRRVAAIFSDGDDTSSWLTSGDVLRAIQKSEVVVYAISTSRVFSPFLRDIAEASGGHVLSLTSEDELRESFSRILDEVQSRYLLGFVPTGVPIEGWHPLSVAVKHRGVTVRARPGYLRARSVVHRR